MTNGWQKKKLMSNDRFGMVFEDPTYDEDGQLVDEDFDELEVPDIDEVRDDFNPFGTVNS